MRRVPGAATPLRLPSVQRTLRASDETRTAKRRPATASIWSRPSATKRTTSAGNRTASPTFPAGSRGAQGQRVRPLLHRLAVDAPVPPERVLLAREPGLDALDPVHVEERFRRLVEPVADADAVAAPVAVGGDHERPGDGGGDRRRGHVDPDRVRQHDRLPLLARGGREAGSSPSGSTSPASSRPSHSTRPRPGRIAPPSLDRPDDVVVAVDDPDIEPVAPRAAGTRSRPSPCRRRRRARRRRRPACRGSGSAATSGPG